MVFKSEGFLPQPSELLSESQVINSWDSHNFYNHPSFSFSIKVIILSVTTLNLLIFINTSSVLWLALVKMA